MSEVTKNKVIKEIEDFDINYKTTISHANLDYLFRTIEAQGQEIERLKNIIKEVREYIEEMNVWCIEFENFGVESKGLLEILDKGSDEISK